MLYLYILYSVPADKYDVGYTDNPERRLREHNHSERKTYTSKHTPWVLKKQIPIGDHRSFAMQIEKAVKKLKSRTIIQKIIDEINDVAELPSWLESRCIGINQRVAGSSSASGAEALPHR